MTLRTRLILSSRRTVLALWMLASLVLFVRFVRSLLAIRRLRAAAFEDEIDGVHVLVTDGVGPATIGLQHPVVIVPRALLELEEPLRRLVLRHEREHSEIG